MYSNILGSILRVSKWSRLYKIVLVTISFIQVHGIWESFIFNNFLILKSFNNAYTIGSIQICKFIRSTLSYSKRQEYKCTYASTHTHTHTHMHTHTHTHTHTHSHTQTHAITFITCTTHQDMKECELLHSLQ